MLETIFEKIRGKRRQAARSVSEQYYELVSALASNDEIDVDYLGEIMEQLGKTETDLEQDVAKVASRSPKQAELKRLRALALTLPKLQRVRDNANAELETNYARLRTVLGDAQQAYNDAENDISQIHFIEASLESSSIDLVLTERRNELNAARFDIGRRLQPLLEDLKQVEGQASYFRRIAGDAIEKKALLEKNDLHGRTQANETIRFTGEQAERSEGQLQRLRDMVDSYQSQVASFDRELAKLRQQMIEA